MAERMRVLVKDKIADSGIEKLKEFFDVDVKQEWTQEEMKAHIKDYDAVIVRSAGKMTEDIIEATDRLKMIGRAGIGLDNVDVEAATRRGIIVANAPQSNIISAAEHAIALLLAQARRIPEADKSLKDGEWKRSKLEGVEVYDKVLGIVGLGRIGGLVATRARGLGMKVIAYDPYVATEKFGDLGVDLVDNLDDLLRQADFISIHLPKNPETKGIIGAQQFAKMKDGVRIVNAARGGIVDEKALYDALTGGKVAGAALDVFENEPPTNSPLFGLREVVVTPHLGASTCEAQDKAGVMIADQVIAGLRGEFVSTAVNISAVPAETAAQIMPFVPLAEMLGALYAHLAGGKMNKLEVEYAGEIAGYDIGILTTAALKGLFSPIVHEPVTYVNAPLIARDRGIEVRETKTTKRREYASLITLTGKNSKNTVMVAGTLGGTRNEPRLVKIDEFEFDMSPAENFALFRYDDKPGVIGAIGTVLGKSNINIGNMQVGRNIEKHEAMMGVNVDSPIPEQVLDTLRHVNNISMAKIITF